MAVVLQLRRDSTANRLAYTPADGEAYKDETLKLLFIGDGATAGGDQIGGVYINSQTGVTTYTVAATDAETLLIFSDASAIAVALAQAGSSSGAFMPANSKFWVRNAGAGAVTITPATSTINGAATLVLYEGQAAIIISDGTNYQAIISVANVEPLQTIFSGLPLSPVRGMKAIITDAVVNAWGATVSTGGGTDCVFAWYNNNNHWTVLGQ